MPDTLPAPAPLTWQPIEHGDLRAESRHVPADADSAYYVLHELSRGWIVQRYKVRSGDGRHILCAYLDQCAEYPDVRAAQDAAARDHHQQATATRGPRPEGEHR
jgi:hypothetical protein